MVVAVVRRGVTPLPQVIGGEIAPDHSTAAAPVGGDPLDDEVEKLVALAPVPPLPAGKSMLAAGLIEPPDEADHPPVDRATLTRV